MTKKKYSKKTKTRLNKTYKTNKKYKKTHQKGRGYKEHNHKHTLKSKTVELNKVNCSPKDKNEIKNFTCYTDKTLFQLRDKWNLRHPYEKINTNDTKEIHKILSNYLSDLCNKESCWLKQKHEFGKLDEDFKDSFAPESPYEWKKNPNEWLSSIDIIKVMKQYEKAYKCFDFIGPTPIDFDKKKL